METKRVLWDEIKIDPATPKVWHVSREDIECAIKQYVSPVLESYLARSKNAIYIKEVWIVGCWVDRPYFHESIFLELHSTAKVHFGISIKMIDDIWIHPTVRAYPRIVLNTDGSLSVFCHDYLFKRYQNEKITSSVKRWLVDKAKRELVP